LEKVRVYALAKELNVESLRILSMLKDRGEFVRSASSTVDPRVADLLRRKINQLPPEERQRLAEARQAPTTKSAGTGQAPSTKSAGTGQAAARPSDSWSFFSPDAKRKWQRFGIYNGDEAWMLTTSGLNPEDLWRKVNGTTVSE
jgi:hypothetical protein